MCPIRRDMGFGIRREPKARTAIAYRLSTWGLVAVLVGLTVFGLSASQYTERVSERALDASRLSNDYSDAAAAVAAEESLERKYRLEPGPTVLASYGRAAADLASALARVRKDGGPSDILQVERLLALHTRYLDAITRMFAAVDVGDAVKVLSIDGALVDPLFGSIERIVDADSREHHATSVSTLDDLRRIERFFAFSTPAIFFLGLLLVAVFSSILRRVRRELDGQRERILHDSMHDRLTGLPNRVMLADRFEQALGAGRGQESEIGFLLVDLDHFKEVNDTLGHTYGDQLLKMVGAQLATVLREGQSVARLGGDEFGVLLPGVNGLAETLAVAERLQVALSVPFVVEGVDLTTEASIGAVVSGLHGDDAATLLQHADIAMYNAKERGVGVLAYDPALDHHTPERLQLIGDLRRALDADELLLHYQPQIDLKTGQICGVEALIRWQHPSRGLVPPDEFIPIAEHTALIAPLTRKVLEMALKQVRAWLGAGYVIPVSVNLSARNLIDEEIHEEILDQLKTYGLPAELLQLEITESAIMADPTRARAMLIRLHEAGLRLSIDDFGAGYTSLGQLKDLPLAELKIDRSFVMSMEDDPANTLIVRSIVELSHNLGLTAVAEGVETESELATLVSYGCDIAQGYLFSRPLTPDALLALYTDNDPRTIGAATGPTPRAA